MSSKEIFPFNLPLELCEIIFDYLNSTEILNCYLVCHSWYDFNINININKKILLTISDDIELEDVFKSNRSYQRIKLIHLNHEKVTKILKFFQSSVVELEIEDCRMNEKCDVNLNFPHLKELTLSNSSVSVINLFHFCEKLKILSLYELHGRRSSNDIITFLNHNKSLQEINFYLDEPCNIFNKDISKSLKVKLKSVFISYKANFELQNTTLTNIEKFLQTQGDTLETISLINSANLILLQRIWNSLKAVRRLYFFSGDPFFDYDTSALQTLEANLTLHELELHALGAFGSLDLNDISPFLMAAKNLKSLGIWTLNKNLIEFVAYNHFNLKLISCATMENDCELFYNDLKSKNGINDKLHLRQYL